jgi:hypothetical protein
MKAHAIAALSLCALLAFAVVATPDAEARRGKPGSGATLAVTPNPVASGTTTITITGAGFGANQDVMVGPRGVIPTVTVRTDGSGAFTHAYSPWDGGFTTVGLYYVDARATNRKASLLATTTFMVE